jgi:DNA mismatch repair protein MutS2
MLRCALHRTRSVGIVHDVSRTGKTLFIEPSAVVEPTNELVELKLALKAEEARVLSRMTMLVSSILHSVIHAQLYKHALVHIHALNCIS